jgi:Domain of unknown function (DUF4365)
MRKRRTRAHIIEDLGFNHVERQVFLAGYTVEKIKYDYGYDGYLQTFNEVGEIEYGNIFLQLKSTDSLKLTKTEQPSIVFDLSIRDLELWLMGSGMMVLIVYDAQLEQAFFVELKDYFEKNKEDLANTRKFVRIYIPSTNVLDSIALTELRTIKNSIYGRN